MTDNYPMLRVDALTFQRGQQQFRYDFDISSGEIMAVLGPSGSGKTTLAELISGFEQPLAGDIYIQGQSIINTPVPQRGVAYVFQHNNLFAHMTVLANLSLAFRPSGRLKADESQRCMDALEKVGLPDMAMRYPNELSIGQQQRIALARAALKNCHVLLLDEPFSALDPGLRIQMGDWLKNLAPIFDMACMLITHQPDEAERLTERTVFIHEGRQIQFGATQELLNSNLPEINEFLGKP